MLKTLSLVLSLLCVTPALADSDEAINQELRESERHDEIMRELRRQRRDNEFRQCFINRDAFGHVYETCY